MARPRKKFTEKKVKKKKGVDKSSHNKGGHTSLVQMEEALRAGGGFLAQAARLLGITRQAVWKRVKNSARLQEALEDIKETHLDLAEIELLKAVRKGEAWAIKYYLNTQGKKRGFVERQELTGAEGKPIPLYLKIERAKRIKLPEEEKD